MVSLSREDLHNELHNELQRFARDVLQSSLADLGTELKAHISTELRGFHHLKGPNSNSVPTKEETLIAAKGESTAVDSDYEPTTPKGCKKRGSVGPVASLLLPRQTRRTSVNYVPGSLYQPGARVAASEAAHADSANRDDSRGIRIADGDQTDEENYLCLLGTPQVHATEWQASVDKMMRRATNFVECDAFEQVMGIIVLLNSVLMGVETDFVLQHAGQKVPRAYHIGETIFCIIFSVELLLRLFVHGRTFFIDDDRWGWNNFDFALVFLQVSDQLSSEYHVVAFESFTSVLRRLRVLRLLRLSRVIRVLRLFDELRTIVTSMTNSIGSLLWAILLLLIVMYIFSILFVQAVLNTTDLHANKELSYWFGSMERTLLTMFECIVGGVDWDHVVVLLIDEVSPFMGFIFCLYIATSIFAMLNLVTGVFVENVATTFREDKDQLMATRITELFLDTAEEITWHDFEAKMVSPIMQEYFKTMDVNPRAFFDLIDADGSGAVDTDEMVHGFLKLRGPARSLEVNVLIREMNIITELLASITPSSTLAARSSRVSIT